MRMRLVAALLAAVIAAGATGKAFAGGGDIESIRETLEGSLAKVSVSFKYDDGDAPGGSSGGGCVWLQRLGLMGAASGYDVDGEQPFVTCGFVLGSDTVLIEDPMVPDRFVDRIEVEIGGKKYAAAMDAFALGNRGVFLKLSERASGGKPILFEAKAVGPYRSVTFAPGESGEWNIQTGPVTEGATITERGRKVMQLPAPALVVDAKGKVVGVSMSERHGATGNWKGLPLLWPQVSAVELGAKMEAVKKAAEAGIAQVTINFRVKQSRRWDSSSYWEDREAPTEKQVAGLIMGKGKVLVLTGLSRRQTAKIESMTLIHGERSVPLTVEGALVRYGALVASFEGEVEGTAPIEQSQAELGGLIDGLLISDELSYDKDAREEHVYRERLAGLARGYMGLLWPNLAGGESKNFVFTPDGKLAIAPIGTRSQMEMGRYGGGEDYEDEGGSMPVGRLAEILAEGSSVDTTWKPQSEEESKKLVWLGIETQDITKDLARAKDVSLATKGGETGVIVSHVYSGSPAERNDVRTGDVFVRFKLATQVKPVDVKIGDEHDTEFPWSQLDQVPDAYFERMPRPWPSQANSLTKVLTEIGAGKKIVAEFIRDKQRREVEFELEFGPPDYNAAASHEDTASGLTVKNVTYEVRQYFKMKEEDPGVVVADIKRGSKASVAGIKPCEIITAVNGKTVSDVEAFKAEIAVGGEVSLTVKRMSQTRVSKMKLAAPATEAQKQTEEGAAAEESEAGKEAEGEGPAVETPEEQPTEAPSDALIEAPTETGNAGGQGASARGEAEAQ